IRLASLGEALRRWLPQRGSLDPEAVARLLAVDEKDGRGFLREVTTLYLQSAPERVRKVSVALVEQNAEMMFREAPALKGAGVNLGALRMALLASRIQSMSRARNWALAARLTEDLEDEFQVLKRSLESAQA